MYLQECVAYSERKTPLHNLSDIKKISLSSVGLFDYEEMISRLVNVPL